MKKYILMVLFLLRSVYASGEIIDFDTLVKNKKQSDLDAHNAAMISNKKLYKKTLLKAYFWHTIATGSILGLHCLYLINNNPNFILTRTKQLAYALGTFSIPILTSYCDVNYIKFFNFKTVMPIANKDFFKNIMGAICGKEKTYPVTLENSVVRNDALKPR